MMAKEFVPRAETKLNESGNENYDLTIPEKKIYSNVNHLQEMLLVKSYLVYLVMVKKKLKNKKLLIMKK